MQKLVLTALCLALLTAPGLASAAPTADVEAAEGEDGAIYCVGLATIVCQVYYGICRHPKIDYCPLR